MPTNKHLTFTREDLRAPHADTPIGDLRIEHLAIPLNEAEKVTFIDTDGTRKVLKERFPKLGHTTYLQESHNLPPQGAEETDYNFRHRIAGALRDSGHLIEAHEAQQNARYDGARGGDVLSGVMGAMAQVFAVVRDRFVQLRAAGRLRHCGRGDCERPPPEDVAEGGRAYDSLDGRVQLTMPKHQVVCTQEAFEELAYDIVVALLTRSGHKGSGFAIVAEGTNELIAVHNDARVNELRHIVQATLDGRMP